MQHRSSLNGLAHADMAKMQSGRSVPTVLRTMEVIWSMHCREGTYAPSFDAALCTVIVKACTTQMLQQLCNVHVLCAVVNEDLEAGSRKCHE